MEVYSEKQYFDQWWIKLVLYAGAGFCVYACIQQLLYKIPFGDHPVSDIGLILITLGFAIFYAFFRYLRFEYSLSVEGLTYRFRPIHGSTRQIKAHEIEWMGIEKYRPLLEYGGWGIRYGRKGLAMTTSGNIGLRVTLKSGKSILLGVLDQEALSAFLQRSEMPFEVRLS